MAETTIELQAVRTEMQKQNENGGFEEAIESNKKVNDNETQELPSMGANSHLVIPPKSVSVVQHTPAGHEDMQALDDDEKSGKPKVPLTGFNTSKSNQNFNIQKEAKQAENAKRDKFYEQQIYVKVEGIEVQDKTEEVIGKLRKLTKYYQQVNDLRGQKHMLSEFKTKVKSFI